MVDNTLHDTRAGTRFAAPPWNEQSAPWRQLDTQLPPDHLAREIRQAMPRLDLTALYNSYAGRGKAPHRPDLMLAVVLFELRRGQRKPSQWWQDTHENARSGGWALASVPPGVVGTSSRAHRSVCRCHEHARLTSGCCGDLTRVERGAWDGSAVAANASRRRLLNAERLQQRVHHLQAVRHDDAQGEPPAEVPAWMAKTPRSRTAQHGRYHQAQEHLGALQVANQHYSPSERRAPDRLVVSTGDPGAALGMEKTTYFDLYTPFPHSVMSIPPSSWAMTSLRRPQMPRRCPPCWRVPADDGPRPQGGVGRQWVCNGD